MEEKQFQEDISYIKQMIENNRRTLVDNGITYILTGMYAVIGSVVSYVLAVNGYYKTLPVFWLSMMAVLIIVNVYLGKKKEKKGYKKTFATEMFNAAWAACGIPITLVAVVFFITGNVSSMTLFVSISSLLGVGYYLTGFINNLKFMKYLAFGWWGAAVLSMFWSHIGNDAQLSLFFAALITVFEIVPGIVIYKKWKRVYNE